MKYSNVCGRAGRRKRHGKCLHTGECRCWPASSRAFTSHHVFAPNRCTLAQIGLHKRSTREPMILAPW